MTSFKTFLLAVLLTCFTFGAQAAEGEVPYVDTETFQEKVLNAPAPVLLQFDAKWCPYCRKMQPVILDFYKKSSGNPQVYKLDVDQDAAIVDQYEVGILPTLILFHRGQEIARQEGALNAEALEAWIAKTLPK